MAQRRMISVKIIDSARFMKMPISSRLLYYDLNIRADDDGIVEAYNVMRMVGAVEDDLRVLTLKGFVTVLNEDLVTYVNDWNEHNLIRPDRKVNSIYKDLLLQIVPDAEIVEKRPRIGTKKQTHIINGQSTDGQMTEDGQHRLGKVRLGKVRLGKVRLVEDSKDKTIPLPTYADDVLLNNSIIEFISFRKAVKKPMTEKAIEMLKTKLNKLSTNTDIQIKILEQSIYKSWTSVYKLEEEGYGANRQGNTGQNNETTEYTDIDRNLDYKG